MQAYPAHLVQQLEFKNGTAVTIRPIRPEDAGIEQEFVRNLSDESRYLRFRDSLRELSPHMVSHFTRIDYDLHLALIAVTGRNDGAVQIGVARYVADAGRKSCEFAIVVADQWQHQGLGTRLMQALTSAARAAGIRSMFGEVHAGNPRMLEFAARLGFKPRIDDNDPRILRVEKWL